MGFRTQIEFGICMQNLQFATTGSTTYYDAIQIFQWDLLSGKHCVIKFCSSLRCLGVCFLECCRIKEHFKMSTIKPWRSI